MTPLQKTLFDIGIVLIALTVVIVGACVIYGRSLTRPYRERKELHRRRVEDEERKRLFANSDDDTKTWSGPEKGEA